MRNIFFALLSLCFIVSCDDDTFDFVGQLADDREIIREYLKTNNLQADSLDSGLYYIIEESGTGPNFPGRFSTVTVKYKGYFVDGQVFDRTTNDPIAIPLANTIRGWQEGIPLIKKNGKIRLFIPSLLAYGDRGSSGVPPNTVIFFDVELLNFQ